MNQDAAETVEVSGFIDLTAADFWSAIWVIRPVA